MTSLQRPRLLILSYRDPATQTRVGAAIYTQEIASSLSRRGHQISRVCMSFRDAKPFEIGDGVLTYPAGSPFYFLLSTLRLIQLRGRFDLLLKEWDQGGFPAFASFLTRVQAYEVAVYN